MKKKVLTSGRFHQTLCATQKVSDWQKIAVQFHQQNLSQISELKFSKSVRHLQNTISYKKQ
jgi:hypothetical protein